MDFGIWGGESLPLRDWSPCCPAGSTGKGLSFPPPRRGKTRILGQSRGWGWLARTGVRSGVQGERLEPGGQYSGPEASHV